MDKKLFLVSTEFATFVTLFSKLRDVIITTIFLKKPARLQLMSKLRGELRRDSKRRCVVIKNDNKHTKSLRCGSVSGGVSIKLMHQSKVTSEKTFPTNKCPLSEERLLQEILRWETFWIRSM